MALALSGALEDDASLVVALRRRLYWLRSNSANVRGASAVSASSTVQRPRPVSRSATPVVSLSLRCLCSVTGRRSAPSWRNRATSLAAETCCKNAGAKRRSTSSCVVWPPFCRVSMTQARAVSTVCSAPGGAATAVIDAPQLATANAANIKSKRRVSCIYMARTSSVQRVLTMIMRHQHAKTAAWAQTPSGTNLQPRRVKICASRILAIIATGYTIA